MSTKRKGAKSRAPDDPSVPVLKPTVASKSSGAKPTAKTWKDWEDEDAREDRVERRSSEKQRKSRAQFMGLVRTVLVFLTLSIVMSMQPFVVRQRAPGVNKIKASPIPIVLAGAQHYGRKVGMPEDKVNATLATVGRALLLPHKYITLSRDKRTPSKDKTVIVAWRKTKSALESTLANTDRLVATNDMLYGGSLLCVLGSVLALLLPGAELAAIIGSVLMFNGGRKLGLEPQPELMALGAMCILVMVSGESARSPAKAKRKAKRG